MMISDSVMVARETQGMHFNQYIIARTSFPWVARETQDFASLLLDDGGVVDGRGWCS